MLRISLTTLAALVLWTAAAGSFLLEGCWKRPLAPRGDVAAFVAAAVERIDEAGPGNLVLAVVEDGDVVAEHAVSIGEAVDRDTAFQVASLSKWIAAWGVMWLVEQGRVELDAPIGRYVSRWQLPESRFDADGVTVRRVLSHTAGFTDGLGYFGFAPPERPQTLEESLTQAADPVRGASGAVRVGVEPGSEFRYSGGGYALLQLMIEEVSGEPFEAFMQRTVLRPLGMHRSTFVWPDDGEGLATFYDASRGEAIHYRFSAPAAASLYTTSADMARFLRAHLPGPDGEPPGRGVLRPDSLEAMRVPAASRFGRAVYGLGTFLYAPVGAGGHVIGHDGNNAPAINTAARLDPATGDGIVVLETGAPMLATTIADEWTFWQTGNLSIFAILTGAKRGFTIVAGGGLLIVLAAGVVSARRLGR